MAVGSFKLPISSGGGGGTEEWVRPTDWLAMPTVTSSDDTFVGLHAIIEDNDNYVAFRFTTSTGQYQVDWGDGSTPTLHDSNTNAQYEYDFATYDTGSVTLTSRGYKQAIITVTPVSGNLLTCIFQVRFVTSPVQNQVYSTGFLDCILSMPNATFAGQSIVFGGTTVRHTYCERFDIKTIGSCQSLSNFFSGCYSLQSVPLFDTSNVTSFLQMFFNCLSIRSIPSFNTINATSVNSMFSTCRSLQTVPLISLGTATEMNNMFNACASLQSVPLFDTSNITSMSNLFQTCTSLQSVPLFNTSNVNNMQSMFNGCNSLQLVPLFNMANVTNTNGMFQSCTSLQSVPLFNTSNVTNMSAMLNTCQSLNSIPALSSVSNTADLGNFAAFCSSLNRCQMIFPTTVSISSGQLSQTALEEIFDNLTPRTGSAATITVTGNWGVGTQVTRTGTTTDGSTTITTDSTTGLVAGMQVTGSGSPLTTPVAVTFQDTGDTVTLNSHGLENDDEVSFATIVSTTGLDLNTIYYIINKTTNTFQVAATSGGSALPLTTNGSGTMRHRTEVVSFVTNTSITMSRPMRASGTVSLQFRALKTGTALLKNWTVVG